MSRYELFDRSRVKLQSVSTRGHDLHWTDCLPLAAPSEPFEHPEFPDLVARIADARQHNRPVVLMMGAHVIKLGLSRYIVDLIERRVVTHVALNGAGIIHDFELALLGGTSESVAHWIKLGQFGLWTETGRLNEIIRDAAQRNDGMGETVGRVIEEEGFSHQDLSIAAAGWRIGIPVTCHVAIGSDIIHAHPNCSGAAIGQTTYTDFLIFAHTIEHLEGGVFLNVGIAVAGPEVYLKALSMARNVARQHGREHRSFTTAVFDLVELPDNYRDGPPGKDHPLYYYRPWKTILVRTVVDGGTSYYFRGDHRQTIPTLWHRLSCLEK